MRKKLLFIPLAAICLSLISATCIPAIENKPAEDTTAKAITSFKSRPELKAKKMGFFQKIAFKIAMHKLKKHGYKIDTKKADKMANNSLLLGSLALVFALIPWYTIFVAIPLGVLAILFGGNAIESGTSKRTNANIGRGLGIAALIVFLVLLVASLIAWASFVAAFGC